ncbi:hypothetical protein CEXT_484321 [Caerostris extrusa]|uniref:Uncharacterized protein n=1 Tax=Caerostris extrusa TaxID=172846 RepID=A0AAV4Y4R9_CAEEX|nr:hypothetical protein CEXT_484321 [Caerostris extrusa]
MNGIVVLWIVDLSCLDCFFEAYQDNDVGYCGSMDRGPIISSEAYQDYCTSSEAYQDNDIWRCGSLDDNLIMVLLFLMRYIRTLLYSALVENAKEVAATRADATRAEHRSSGPFTNVKTVKHRSCPLAACYLQTLFLHSAFFVVLFDF